MLCEYDRKRLNIYVFYVDIAARYVIDVVLQFSNRIKFPTIITHLE